MASLVEFPCMFFFLARDIYSRKMSRAKCFSAFHSLCLFYLRKHGFSSDVMQIKSKAAATVVPCLSTLVSAYGSASQKGTVMGILRSLGALARALGPIISSTVYWWAGAEICFIISSAFFIVPLVLLRLIKQTKTE